MAPGGERLRGPTMNDYPSIHAELSFSHAYADTTMFTTRNLIERRTSVESQKRDTHTSIRALGELATISARLDFELKSRELDSRELHEQVMTMEHQVHPPRAGDES